MKRLFILLLLLFAGPASAETYYLSGNKLMGYCTNSADTDQGTADRDFCSFYLMGVVDTESMLKSWGIWKDSSVCIPDGVRSRQLRTVFVKHMNKHRVNWREPVARWVFIAFKEAWPCEQ